MLKKILKIIGIISAIIILAIAGLAFWYRDTISIMSSNQDIHGTTKVVPKTVNQETLPLTKGNADWLCWRGANRDGRSAVTGIITDWSGGLEKIWEVDYLCRGKASATWSAPVIQGNRLIVTGRKDSSDVVFCLHSHDGRLIWKKSYPAKPGNAYGTGSRATPWIDDDRVYTFGRNGDLVCWNLLDGSKQWHKNVNDEGGKEATWGYSTSPLVTDSLVIVNGGGSARTIAYHKMTGEVIWKSGNGIPGYAAIMKMLIEDEPVILTFHGKGLAALALDDGTELWNIPWETSYDVNATTPLIFSDLVFMTSGYGTGCQLLRATKSEAKILWKNKTLASHHSDPLIIKGYIYGYSGDSMQNRGTFKCMELKTGIEKWSTNDMGWGTCVYVEGYLLCSDIKGNLFLMQPNPEKFTLITGMPKALGNIRGAAWTIPVLANGKLYLRFKQKLVCYNISASIS